MSVCGKFCTEYFGFLSESDKRETNPAALSVQLALAVTVRPTDCKAICDLCVCVCLCDDM